MIVGLGADLIEIERVKQAHLKHGQRFIERLFGKRPVQKKRDRHNRRSLTRFSLCLAFRHNWGRRGFALAVVRPSLRIPGSDAKESQRRCRQ